MYIARRQGQVEIIFKCVVLVILVNLRQYYQLRSLKILRHYMKLYILSHSIYSNIAIGNFRQTSASKV